MGTPCYLAPEMLQNEDYGPPVDAWGAGCVLLEMLTLSFLWDRKGLLALHVLTRPVMEHDFPQVRGAHALTHKACTPAQDPPCSARSHAANHVVRLPENGATHT